MFGITCTSTQWDSGIAMWCDSEIVHQRLEFFLDESPIITINATDPNYERAAFDGDIFRHNSDIRAIVVHETGVPHTTSATHKDYSFMHLMFGTRKQPDYGNYRPANIYINRASQVYVLYYYPTHHIDHSPTLWDIPQDELNRYGFSIIIEANNDVSDEQLHTASLVAVAVMDVAGLDSDRVVSNLQQDHNWLEAVTAVRGNVQVVATEAEHQTDAPISEPPDLSH